MALSAKQKLLAELMVAKPELTNEEYAKEIGIDPKTLYVWKKKSEFQDYLHQACKEKFKDLEQLAVAKLKENIQKNNQKAIEYALDYLDYKATTKVEADINSDITITIGEE
jgi:transposase-like protein